MSFAHIAAITIHDVKNSLSSIASAAESHGDTPTVQAIFNISDTLTRLLVFYRSEHELLRLNLNSHAPEDLIFELAANKYGQSDIEINSELNQAPVLWVYDEMLVRMILVNALQNASRYAKSRIVISAKECSGYLEMSVHDDGPGFSDTVLEEDYSNIPASQNGTGLGLLLAKRIAALHVNNNQQGRIELSNQNGGLFRLILPA
ncbi:sensor histidine kinase [Undibacterium sp. Dicai25W]|uniref:sensor histidine kinase n=1 Tax=Undibacterium sp. Dicai25W TaxID=3413034 RepID=UPI003BF14A16